MHSFISPENVIAKKEFKNVNVTRDLSLAYLSLRSVSIPTTSKSCMDPSIFRHGDLEAWNFTHKAVFTADELNLTESRCR